VVKQAAARQKGKQEGEGDRDQAFHGCAERF
jgi:hypothetical protein